MSTFGTAGDDVRARLLPRWTWQFVTLMWAAIIVRLQTPAARRYEQLTDGGYASMWRAGLYWSLVSIVVFRGADRRPSLAERLVARQHQKRLRQGDRVPHRDPR